MKILNPLLLISFGWVSLFPLNADDLEIREREFGDIEERSEYEGVTGASSILKRWWVNKHGKSEELVPFPADLDERSEAILDAIWNDDEDAFSELVKSPTTGGGKLTNQKFSKITSELRKMDRWPLRTMRSHPVIVPTPRKVMTVKTMHQLMMLPAHSKTPRRGNINLIFRQEDWSLAFVRVNWFDNDKVNLLPQPYSSIENDPVVDRGVPVEKKGY